MSKVLFLLSVYIVKCCALDLFFNSLEFTNSKDPEDCDCVPYFLCKNQTISTTGEEIIDIRFVESTLNKTKEPCSNFFILKKKITSF